MDMLSCSTTNRSLYAPQDHPKLGSAGDEVTVKAGYARHTLYPSKVADYAVPGVLRRMRVGRFG